MNFTNLTASEFRAAGWYIIDTLQPTHRRPDYSADQFECRSKRTPGIHFYGSTPGCGNEHKIFSKKN